MARAPSPPPSTAAGGGRGPFPDSRVRSAPLVLWATADALAPATPARSPTDTRERTGSPSDTTLARPVITGAARGGELFALATSATTQSAAARPARMREKCPKRVSATDEIESHRNP